MLTTHHNGVEREMTADEITEYEATVAAAQADRATAEATKAAKEAIRTAALAKLGLTDDEIAVLFGADGYRNS